MTFLFHAERRWRGLADVRSWLLMRAFQVFAILALFAFVDSGRCGETNLAAHLDAVGGADLLKQECTGFINLYSENGGSKYRWTARDTNFPPGIASFHPLAISIRTQQRIIMVDVRITNGPPQHGLVIAPGKLPTGFIPRLGPEFDVRAVTNGVFQYHD
jgi:hypothetical protein